MHCSDCTFIWWTKLFWLNSYSKNILLRCWDWCLWAMRFTVNLELKHLWPNLVLKYLALAIPSLYHAANGCLHCQGSCKYDHNFPVSAIFALLVHNECIVVLLGARLNAFYLCFRFCHHKTKVSWFNHIIVLYHALVNVRSKCTT